jgi:hypothetical protein
MPELSSGHQELAEYLDHIGAPSTWLAQQRYMQLRFD